MYCDSFLTFAHKSHGKQITLREIIPDMHQSFMQLSQAVANSGVDKLHQELIKIRASQINGDPDAHVPVERVKATTKLLKSMNASVTEKVYLNMGHTITQPEIVLANKLIFK